MSQRVYDFMVCTDGKGLNRDILERSVETNSGNVGVKTKIVDVGAAANMVIDQIKLDGSTPTADQCRIIEHCATLSGSPGNSCAPAPTAKGQAPHLQPQPNCVTCRHELEGKKIREKQVCNADDEFLLDYERGYTQAGDEQGYTTICRRVYQSN